MFAKLPEGKHKVYLVELFGGYNSVTGMQDNAIKVGVTSYRDAIDRFYYSKHIGENSMIDYFDRVRCIASIVVDSRQAAEKIEEKILKEWGDRDFITNLYMKGVTEIRKATLERILKGHEVINRYKARNVYREKVLHS